MAGPLARRLLVLLLTCLAVPAGAAEPLVADLSNHLVAITTGFAGTEVLLFGAVEQPLSGRGGDVVVVVRGPSRTETVRRKARTGGVWVNSGTAEVVGAPSFYRVAASRGLEEIAAEGVLARHQIGLEHVTMEVRGGDADASAADYRRAMVRLKQRQGLYGDGVEEVGFLGRRLFRTDIRFPANVPVGTYLVEVYLLVQGEVVSARTTPLVISKIGLGAQLYDFAHRSAALYGIIAVLAAAGAGWLAAVAFRKG